MTVSPSRIACSRPEPSTSFGNCTMTGFRIITDEIPD